MVIPPPFCADVRGNLGEAGVVTSEKVDDWLKDRWQVPPATSASLLSRSPARDQPGN